MKEATRLKYNLPLPTPEELAAKERQAALRAQLKQRLEQKRRAEAINQPWLAGEEGILSPKTRTTTDSATPRPDTLTATRSGALPPEAAPHPEILSPKMEKTTNSAATQCATPPIEDDLERDAAALEAAVLKQCPNSLHANDDFHHPDANDPRLRIQLYQERLDRHKRQERQKQRAADKKAKAAKKRAEAQRRRAA